MTKLLDWQKTMVQKIRKDSFLLLNADTGIGKSLMVRELVHAAKSGLIICPPHLVLENVSELRKLGDEVIVIEADSNVISKEGIYVMSTNKMALYGVKINVQLAILVCDELHRWKSHKSELWKNTMRIVGKFYYKVGISATVAPKNTADLAPMLLMLVDEIRNKYNGSWYELAAECILMQKKWFGTKSIDVPVKLHDWFLKEVKQKYLTSMSYSQAGLEVPECIFKVIKFDVDEDYYDKMEDVELPVDGDDENIMGYRFTDFVQLSNCFIYKDVEEENGAKEYCMKEKKETVKSILDGHEGKGVIFYWYRHSLKVLKSLLGKDFMMYEPGMDLSVFDKSDKKILLSNYKSMGEGTRVKSADFIINFDLIYDGGLKVQALGRLRYVGRPTLYTVYDIEPNHPSIKRITNNINKKISTMEGLKEV